jgi:putative membrane protein
VPLRHGVLALRDETGSVANSRLLAHIQTRMSRSKAIWKGVVAGAAGGLAGAWTMNQAQAAISKLKKQEPSAESRGEAEDATMKAADKIISMPSGRHLSREQKKIGGPIVHYAFGAAMGAAYGAITDPLLRLGPAAGLIFGSALFVGADEIGVPLAGLSGPPAETPISTHLAALAAHLVYGVTADLVRRGVRAAI